MEGDQPTLPTLALSVTCVPTSRSFFHRRDGDGSIEPREAMVYIESVGGEELDTDQERAEAFESMMVRPCFPPPATLSLRHSGIALT